MTVAPLTLVGGVFIPDRRCVYYRFPINWVDGEGGMSDEIRPLGQVARNILTGLLKAFGTCP